MIQTTHGARVREAQRERLKGQVPKVEDMFNAPAKRLAYLQGRPSVAVGDLVEVSYDYQPGLRSDGGLGEVMDVSESEPITVMIRYILDIREEWGIPLRRLTRSRYPTLGPATLRSSTTPSKPQMPPVEVTPKSLMKPVERLRKARSTTRHTMLGWLKRDLIADGEITEINSSLRQRMLADFITITECAEAIIEP